jgi:hypothetical protein
VGADGAFNIFTSADTHFIVDVTGYFSAEPTDVNGTGMLYYQLPRPFRLLDTRPGQTACFAPGVPLAGGQDRTQPARVICEGITIPATAQSVAGNATVVNTLPGGQSGWITLYPAGAARPNASNLNFTANHIVPNAFVVSLSQGGAFNIFASTSTDFIVDLTGYFAP